MFRGYHHLRKHPYNQIQSVKLQKGCVSYSWPRGPGLRTYGPTVVPPHRWRWLKRWSSCNRCNEHKKVRWWSAARVGRFLSTRNGHEKHEKLHVSWRRNDLLNSWRRCQFSESKSIYVYTNGCWTIKFRPPVATNIPYHPVVSCYLKTKQYFLGSEYVLIWLHVFCHYRYVELFWHVFILFKLNIYIYI